MGVPPSAPRTASSHKRSRLRRFLLSIDSKTDSVGEFIWLLYAAGLLCCKASAAKRETWVGRSDGSTSQETIRLTLIAVAVITCWRVVFGNSK